MTAPLTDEELGDEVAAMVDSYIRLHADPLTIWGRDLGETWEEWEVRRNRERREAAAAIGASARKIVHELGREMLNAPIEMNVKVT